MQLKKTLIIALTLSIIGLIAWESYWRAQGYYPTINDDKHLWAVQRAKVKHLTTKDVIITGSSRVLFDIQLDDWEQETGRRPIQLATVGSSPLPIFHDIVNNTDYAGTIVVGVTPGLFFSTTYPEAFPWKRPMTKVDHFHDRTYAQRLNQTISLPLQKTFVFLSAGEEELDDDIDLKTLLRQIKMNNRTGAPVYPPFHEFGDITEDRNVSMTNRTVNDTAFANSIKKVWKFILTSGELPPPDKESTMKYFVEDAKKFKEKGGNLILLRCPSSGMFKGGETQFLPRKEFWDDLLRQTNSKGFHYEDYEQFQNFICPEWSHLSAEDAKFFTSEMAKIMIADGAITNQKSN